MPHIARVGLRNCRSPRAQLIIPYGLGNHVGSFPAMPLSIVLSAMRRDRSFD